MPLTKDEFDEICQLVCPHCRAGNASRYRVATNEWVHDFTGKGDRSQTICWGSGLKTSHFAKEAQ